MIGHDWATTEAACAMAVDPKAEHDFVEDCKNGLVIGLGIICLIALVADIVVLVMS